MWSSELTLSPPPSLIKSNKKPPKLGKIHIRTSMGIQPLPTDKTIQSGIPSSALGTPGETSSPQLRRSHLPNQTANAARPRTAWRADEDRPHRFTAHANLCKRAQEVQEPRTSSAAWTNRERSSAEDIATPREGLDKDKSQRKSSAPRDTLTHAIEKHRNSHTMYRQIADTYQIQTQTSNNNKHQPCLFPRD